MDLVPDVTVDQEPEDLTVIGSAAQVSLNEGVEYAAVEVMRGGVTGISQAFNEGGERRRSEPPVKRYSEPRFRTPCDSPRQDALRMVLDEPLGGDALYLQHRRQSQSPFHERNIEKRDASLQPGCHGHPVHAFQRAP